MTEGDRETARPATEADLKRLLLALAAEQVDYVLIAGYDQHAWGYQRATVDIDLLLRPDRSQGERVQRGLMTLPDQAAKELDPDWFVEGDTIRVADAFVVDLIFNASGESIETLRDHVVTIDFDGVPVHTLDLEDLLKTKQTTRDKDRGDRAVLEQALRDIAAQRARDLLLGSPAGGAGARDFADRGGAGTVMRRFDYARRTRPPLAGRAQAARRLERGRWC